MDNDMLVGNDMVVSDDVLVGNDGIWNGDIGMIGGDGGFLIDGNMGYDGVVSDGTLADGGVKDPVLSSWLFVGGITALTLAISIVLGILLAKKRIKKGFDLYEI